jgi:hypothetical protein
VREHRLVPLAIRNVAAAMRRERHVPVRFHDGVGVGEERTAIPAAIRDDLDRRAARPLSTRRASSPVTSGRSPAKSARAEKSTSRPVVVRRASIRAGSTRVSFRTRISRRSAGKSRMARRS